MDNLQAAIDAARQGAIPTKLHEQNGVAHWLVPGVGEKASRIERIELAHDGAAPLRKGGRIVVFDAASLNQVIKDNSDAGNIAIYFDRNPAKPAVVAVLNGNGVAGPGWGDFRVSIDFRPTPQWVKWQARDGRMVSQAEFAEFIEDNADDIAEPSGATMLEIASYLEIARNVNFRSGIRLSSGAVQFRHDQDDTAKVGANTIDVPSEFKLGIAPIFGMKAYSVPVRFRYRLLDGKLALGFKLQRVESLMGLVVGDVIAAIERGANISVLDGLPPA